MKVRLFLVALLLGTTAPATFADPVGCPDLTKVTQAGTCPTEEDLLFTFNGYCSDNARIYGKGAEVCTDYRLYREKKNIVLWESADSDFQAYVSCDLPAATLRALKPNTIAVSRQGKLTRLACGYPEGVTFTYRTRAECRIDNAERCRTDASACKASCE